jgi:serine/threonine protein phosphatase PrpC
VADCLGGEAAGESAAQTAITSLEGLNPDSDSIGEALVESMHTPNHEILEEVAEKREIEGMGTTMTALFQRGGVTHWVHVGDSRLYPFRENRLVQITENHTPAGLLLSNGEITKEEARNHSLRSFLFECIGCEEFNVDQGSFDVKEGDLLLLSTDGLHDEVPEKEIAFILESDGTVEDKLNALAQASLDARGRDNITAVGVQM